MSQTSPPPSGVALSVLLPIRDGEAVLPRLCERLYPVLDGLGQAYEVVLIDDGSRDRSATLLRQQHRLRPDATRVLLLRHPAGREVALRAGVEISHGARLLTLDLDLPHPPEAIPRMLAELDRGHDCVGSFRRRPPAVGWPAHWRAWSAQVLNGLRMHLAGVRLHDPGGGLRAYERPLLEAVLASGRRTSCLAALAGSRAVRPGEIEIETAGEPPLSWWRIARLHLDLLTGVSPRFWKILSGLGAILALPATLGLGLLAAHGLVFGFADTGGFLRLGWLTWIAGLLLLGLGLLGETMDRLQESLAVRPPLAHRAHVHLRPKRDPEPSDE